MARDQTLASEDPIVVNKTTTQLIEEHSGVDQSTSKEKKNEDQWALEE